MNNLKIITGDCRVEMAQIPDASVQCVPTSPPYWGLRSYLKKEDARKHLEIGQEKIPDCLAWAAGSTSRPLCGECYVCAIRKVFGGRERDEGGGGYA